MLLNCGLGEDSWDPLDCKEIQPVHPKVDQSLVFTGRTDVEAEAPILWHPAFFVVQIPHPYMTTGKTIALTLGTFVGNVMSLLFNTLPRFVIDFLPRSKRLLIWWLQLWNKKTLTPWKESYDKPRQCIKKQRHHFASKGPSSQGYGLSSSHVRVGL